MDGLIRSTGDRERFASYEQMMCPRCEREKFRSETDSAGLNPFEVFRSKSGGDLWGYREAKMIGIAGPELLVCMTCEEDREKAHRPGKRLKLVAFDSQTGAEKEIDGPIGEMHWT